MIAASIALAFALYFTNSVTVKVLSSMTHKTHRDLTPESAFACIAWATFYYLTHA